MINITLETSCLRSLAKNDRTPADDLVALEQLISLSKQDVIKIWVSPKSLWEIEERIAQETDVKRKQAWEETKTIMESFEELPGLFMLGFSHLGIDTYLASERDAEFMTFLEELAHPYTKQSDIARGHLFDISILVDHRHNDNDLFVTRDKRFLKTPIAQAILNNWTVVVCGPIEAIKHVLKK